MLWEVELTPAGRDAERERVCDEFDLLTHSVRGADVVTASAAGYLVEGPLDRAAIDRLCDRLFADPLLETLTVRELDAPGRPHAHTVLYKPGVMDPVAQSVRKAAADLGIPADDRCGRSAGTSARPTRRRPTATCCSAKSWPTTRSNRSSPAR